MHHLSYVGDKGQLKPFKSIGNKFALRDSLFDLAISHVLERFTIYRQTDVLNPTKHFYKFLYIICLQLLHIQNNFH